MSCDWTMLFCLQCIPVGQVHDLEPGADGLDGALHRHDPPGALGGHVQVVGDGPGRDLEHLAYVKR